MIVSKIRKKIYHIIDQYEVVWQKYYIARLRFYGAKISKNIKIYGKFTVVGNPKNLTISDNVTINHGVFINCSDKVYIGHSTRISAFVKIFTTGLEEDIIPRKHIRKPVKIGSNVWIASQSIVSFGVIINDYSIIGANSFVTKNIDKSKLFAGSPAKKNKRY